MFHVEGSLKFILLYFLTWRHNWIWSLYWAYCWTVEFIFSGPINFLQVLSGPLYRWKPEKIMALALAWEPNNNSILFFQLDTLLVSIVEMIIRSNKTSWNSNIILPERVLVPARRRRRPRIFCNYKKQSLFVLFRAFGQFPRLFARVLGLTKHNSATKTATYQVRTFDSWFVLVILFFSKNVPRDYVSNLHSSAYGLRHADHKIYSWAKFVSVAVPPFGFLDSLPEHSLVQNRRICIWIQFAFE